MGLFDQFPYTNFHELNLDWILRALKDLEHTIEQFVSINALKFADPIQWNITSQYEKNTIVIDPVTGTAYISVEPVPAGVSLSNTDYWTVVFDLGSFIVKAAKNFTSNYEEATTLTATFPTTAGEWLVWGDTLYKTLVNITAGDAYVVNSNIKQITMEEIIGHLDDLTTTDKSNLVAAINEVLQLLVNTTGDPDDLNTTDKSNLVAAINEVLQLLVDTTGDLDDLNTTDKSNLVAAINEVDDHTDTNTSNIITLLKNMSNGLSFRSSVKVQKFGYTDTLSGDSYYNSMQGCAYNSNADHLLIAIIHDDSEGMLVELASDYLTVIQRKTFTNKELAHANDICYNPITNKYYVAGYTSIAADVSNKIMEFDGTSLNYIRTIQLDPPSTDGNYVAGKIAYDAVNDVYYTFGNYIINKYDSSFNLLESINYDFAASIRGSYSVFGYGSVTSQAMEFIDGKLAIIMMAGSTDQALIVMLNPEDGTIFNTIVPEGLTVTEPEGLFVKNGNLYVVFGNVHYAVTELLSTNEPFFEAGQKPLIAGAVISPGADLDDLFVNGIYNCPGNAVATTLNNPPTLNEFQLCVIPVGANVLQIAFNAHMVACRMISYAATVETWKYIFGNPRLVQESLSNIICPGLITDGCASIYAEVPIGYIWASIVNIDAYTLYAKSIIGNLNDGVNANYISSANCTASITGKTKDGIVVKIVRNDSQPFAPAANNNTPVVCQFAPFTYTQQ